MIFTATRVKFEKNVMFTAWKIAKDSQNQFQIGTVKDYFASALKMAWVMYKDEKLKRAITKFLNLNKNLSRGFTVVLNIDRDFPQVNFSGINFSEFTANEIWKIGKDKYKIVNLVDFDGDCFLRITKVK